MSSEAVEADRGVRAWIPLTVAVTASIVVFAPTLSLLSPPDSATTAASTAALLPFGALIAAIGAAGRGGPPSDPKLEPAMLGAIPMLFIATALSVLGVARLGYDFHEAQLGMVAWVTYAIGLLMLTFGVRAVTRHGAIAVLVLTLPPIARPLLQLLEGWMTDIMQLAAQRMASAFGLGVEHRGDGTFASSATDRLIQVASTCSGVDALALALVTLCGVLVVHEGSGWAKLLLTLLVAPLVLLGNIVRITVLLALHGGGHDAAFDVVHASGGAVAAVIIAVVLVLVAPRFQLRLRWVGFAGHRVRYTRTHLVAGTLLVLAASAACIVGQRAAYEQQDMTAGSVVQLAWIDADADREDDSDDGGRPRIALEADGHEVRPDASFPWMRTIFGAESEAGAYTLLAPGRAPVWAQVVTATSRRAVDRYAPLDCFVAHGARIVRVQRIELPGGAGMLVDQRIRGTAFSALSWRQRAVMPDGSQGWRRVVLFSLAERGRDQEVPAASGAGDRAAFDILNVLSPAAARSPRGWAYGPSGRRLVDAAESILAA